VDEHDRRAGAGRLVMEVSHPAQTSYVTALTVS
jgi:hypothetical protein